MTARRRAADVIVIGGGILGCAATYHLARAGVEVTLVERGELNREASGANAGSLHFQILRLPDYRPETLERQRPWMSLRVESSRLWSSLERELGVDLGLRRGGGLVVAETAEEVLGLKAKSAFERSLGLDTVVVSGAEVRDLCPGLSETVRAASHCREEGYANTLLLAPAFARRAEDLGARIHRHTEVLGLERADGGFRVATSKGTIFGRRVVVAAGAWSGRVAALAGARVPVGGRVQHVQATERMPPALEQLVQHAGHNLTLKQDLAGNYLIGGGWPGRLERTGQRSQVLAESLAGNSWVAIRTLPILSGARLIRAWAGLSPRTPDGLPLIAESPSVAGLYLLQVGSGFTLGPLGALLLAQVLTSGRTDLPIGAFGFDRFG